MRQREAPLRGVHRLGLSAVSDSGASDAGTVALSDTSDGAPNAVVAVPDAVRGELRRGVGSVLVDAAALRLVRERFDGEQAGALRRYLEASQSGNTVRAYRSDWIGWAAWCAAEGRQALPADALDVAVYLAAAADARRDTGEWAFSPATLERKAAAVAAVHAANGLPSPTRSDVVRLTLRGIRRTRRTPPTRKRPVLLHTLDQLLAQLPDAGWPTEPARRRDCLALLIGFAGALRRSELAGLRIADVRVQQDHTTGEPVLLVHLPTTKTDPTGVAEQRVALPRGQRPRTCPVCAFADWVRLLEIHTAGGTLAVRAALAERLPDSAIHRCHGFTGTSLADSPDLPLFPTINRHGGIGDQPMSGRAVAELVKRYAARAGLDPDLFSGHSLRAGFATQAALGGASDREIMRQGRWSNPRTVHGYIRTANPLEDNAVTKLGL
ncbi:site-specific integrase [Nocardia otitidiscaviarum]|nr:site-specific integrase [Nocardia otitidiscaviarum]